MGHLMAARSCKRVIIPAPCGVGTKVHPSGSRGSVVGSNIPAFRSGQQTRVSRTWMGWIPPRGPGASRGNHTGVFKTCVSTSTHAWPGQAVAAQSGRSRPRTIPPISPRSWKGGGKPSAIPTWTDLPPLRRAGDLSTFPRRAGVLVSRKPGRAPPRQLRRLATRSLSSREGWLRVRSRPGARLDWPTYSTSTDGGGTGRKLVQPPERQGGRRDRGRRSVARTEEGKVTGPSGSISRQICCPRSISATAARRE